jgi:hypothetical protein
LPGSIFLPCLPIDIIGREIVYQDDLKVQVTGIVKDLNETTSFTAKQFISFSTIAKTGLQQNFMMNIWNDWMAYAQLYVKLSRGSEASQVENQLKGLLKKYNKDANKDANNTMAFRLQPLDDLHFNSNYAGVGQRLAHKPTLYGLLAIGTFLLLLGCINFINLTTARAHREQRKSVFEKPWAVQNGSWSFSF